ncbi:40S ribosomal protein S4 isoform X3 [Gossypium hirsutum]|uniref:40S ribosomal protein S4 isoform X3 n=1 Tax=Gossypium hirsutum TaxID=3635 RepID=A0A1U8JUX0_GOSHI|nr:40S ribosomal protein S4 isoform X3 [Gossypium hirsutum]XP_040944668.1 40S ribosomal protein S4 isoform X3 [Gossypium hirsutum]
MRARELKKHLKRLNALRHWMLEKLGGAFICCFPELSFGFLTSPMLLHFNFVFIVFVNAGAKAIIWTPQVEGMVATYSHSAKQTKVCFDIQRSDFYSYAKACYGRCGKGAHGFMRTHKWRDSIGAFINVEASGTGDLVCKSGPGSWPSSVYAQLAIYPMAHSAAQMGVGEYDQRANIRYADSQPSSGFLDTQHFAQPNMTRTFKPTC